MILVEWHKIIICDGSLETYFEKKYFSSIEAFLRSDFWEKTKSYHDYRPKDQVLNEFKKNGYFEGDRDAYKYEGEFFNIGKVPTMEELLKEEKEEGDE